jgi:hypothetical protein
MLISSPPFHTAFDNFSFSGYPSLPYYSQKTQVLSDIERGNKPYLIDLECDVEILDIEARKLVLARTGLLREPVKRVYGFVLFDVLHKN